MPVNQYSKAADWIEGGPDVKLSREFDAPVTLIFNLWTKSDHLAQW